MAVNISSADSYIGLNVIQAEDWQDSDSAKKQRLLNVAERELSNYYPDYTIPDNAVYEYAANIAIAFNDTNKNRQNGVASFSVDGLSFTFKDGSENLSSLIPKSALDIISKENDVTISKVKWTVL